MVEVYSRPSVKVYQTDVGKYSLYYDDPVLSTGLVAEFNGFAEAVEYAMEEFLNAEVAQ